MPRAQKERTDLSAAFVKSAPPGEHWDGKEAGLGLRVSARGKRTWFLRYRAAGGQYRRFSIGEYPEMGLKEARDAAQTKKAEVSKGQDPAALRKVTFGELAEAALAYIDPQTRPSTVALRRQMLDLDLLPRWRNRPASTIRRADVAALGRDITARGAPSAANRTVALVRLLYNAGIDLELVEVNPAARPGRFLQKESPRERDLSPDELRAILQAAGAEAPEPRAFAELALFTAQRAGAVAGARWEELDLGAQLWTIPAEAGRKFSGHARLVPLSTAAVTTLARLWEHSREGEPYLFPARDRTKGPHWTNWQKLNGRLRTRSKVTGWSLHTFRTAFRTAATRDLGIHAEVADAVLGHTLGTVGHLHYNADKARYLLPEKADALRRWAEYLEHLTQGTKAKR